MLAVKETSGTNFVFIACYLVVYNKTGAIEMEAADTY